MRHVKEKDKSQTSYNMSVDELQEKALSYIEKAPQRLFDEMTANFGNEMYVVTQKEHVRHWFFGIERRTTVKTFDTKQQLFVYVKDCTNALLFGESERLKDFGVHEDFHEIKSWEAGMFNRHIKKLIWDRSTEYHRVLEIKRNLESSHSINYVSINHDDLVLLNSVN